MGSGGELLGGFGREALLVGIGENLADNGRCGVHNEVDHFLLHLGDHAADHFIARFAALHRFFVEHRPDEDARPVAVAPDQPAERPAAPTLFY